MANPQDKNLHAVSVNPGQDIISETPYIFVIMYVLINL
jgi:hypothetical protein